MFTLLKNVLRLRSTSINMVRLKPIMRCISTSQNFNSKNLLKKFETGGLSTDFVNEQTIKNSARISTTLKNYSITISAKSTTLKDEEYHDFREIFDDVVRDLTEEVDKYNSTDASKWFARALQYNVPHGKKNRGILTVLTYKNLVDPVNITEENLKLVRILGWCVEMLQSFFIITDDVMDNSSSRRGQPCWHKQEDVGLIALNDAIMIESAIYILLRKHFSHMPCYIDLVHLFHEITFITTCGQTMDLLNATKSATFFNMDKYKAIVANKTAHYSFYLPFALAMHLAGIKDQEAFRQSKSILLEMGHFFQVQDDFLDCFGNPEVTGKNGTDIQDNKCSWLAVLCMERANKEQKQIMIDCYGKNDAEKAARVKDLYKALGLPNIYAIYEEESYNMIKARIQQLSPDVPKKIFLQILHKIYQRDS